MLTDAIRRSQMSSCARICSQMLSDAPKCSDMLSYACKCPHIPPHALTCLHMLSGSLRCSTCVHMLSYVFICCQVLSNTSICSHIPPGDLIRSQKLSDLSKSYHPLGNPFKSTRILSNPSRSSQMSWRRMLFAFAGAWARRLRNVVPSRPLRARMRP